MMQKPDVDQIDGLSPAISIEQKTTSKNPRSTVGTVTEIHDYMRLLWARAGIPYSPATGLPIESQTVQQMVDRLVELPEKTRGYLLAPVVRGRKGEFRKEMAEWLKRGFQRVKVNGEFYEIPDAPPLDKKFRRHRRGRGPHRDPARSRRAAGGFAGAGAGADRRHRGLRICR
ncbi:UvrABC system protein A [Bosea thiooxidans]